MSVLCPWCNACITTRLDHCPECGCTLPGPEDLPRPRAAAAATPRGGHWLWGLLCLPLASVIAAPLLALALHAGVPLAAARPCRHYADPGTQAVWDQGRAALRQRLGPATMKGFTTGDVRLSPGPLLTLCGEVPIPGDESPTRVLSLNGTPENTLVDRSRPDFDRLWRRLCASGTPQRPGTGRAASAPWHG